MESPAKKEELSIPMYDIKSHELYFAERILEVGTVSMKYVSLLTLTLQNAGLSLLMRVVRTQRDLFIASTAVLMAEILKFITSILVCWLVEEGSFRNFVLALKTCIIKQPYETLKVSVPSFIYLLQNNLLYLGATHLDAATCQVTYQLKILTTAVLSMVMLKKKLNMHQWISLVILFLGVALVQVAQMNADPPAHSNHVQKPLLGLSAVVGACCLSGFAGVYFEKILKSSEISVWMRNIQLCLTSVPLGLCSVYLTEGKTVASQGFFFGYNYLVWCVIAFQAIGGLIVAVVVMYADNILKGFATSLAIVISCLLSMHLFEFKLTVNFALGASLVIGSTFLYSRKPPTDQHKK